MAMTYIRTIFTKSYVKFTMQNGTMNHKKFQGAVRDQLIANSGNMDL